MSNVPCRADNAGNATDREDKLCEQHSRDARHRLAHRNALFPFRGQVGRARPSRRGHHHRACCWSAMTCCSTSGATASTMRCRRRTGTALSTRPSSSSRSRPPPSCFQVYQLYLNQWLQIRWRKWMTTKYLGEWLHDANHYRMQLQGDAADNPDQRIVRRRQAVRRAHARHQRRPAECDRFAFSPSSSSCGACRRQPRCICSTATSTFPAIWSGRR